MTLPFRRRHRWLVLLALALVSPGAEAVLDDRQARRCADLLGVAFLGTLSLVLLAKELAQLDQLSGGRLLLSFVTGLGQPGERRALGLNGARRGDVLEEVLGLVGS